MVLEGAKEFLDKKWREMEEKRLQNEQMAKVERQAYDEAYHIERVKMMEAKARKKAKADILGPSLSEKLLLGIASLQKSQAKKWQQ
jgi:hypothetical protein